MLNQTNPDAGLGDLRSEYADGTNPHPFLTRSGRRPGSLAGNRPRHLGQDRLRRTRRPASEQRLAGSTGPDIDQQR